MRMEKATLNLGWSKPRTTEQTSKYIAVSDLSASVSSISSLKQVDSNTRNRIRNRNLQLSTAPTKAKSREPAYSQALNQNKIDRVGVKIQRVGQADSQTAMVGGAWS